MNSMLYVWLKLYRTLTISGVIVLMLACLPLEAVVINKAFLHRGVCEDKLVFYFETSPEIVKQVGQNKSNHGRQIIYQINQVTLAPGVEQSLIDFANLDLEYALEFKLNQNLKIKFNLNQNSKILVSKFKPISAPYGLVIKILKVMPNISKCKRQVNAKEIVLDFGHGGSDSGAVNGLITEKNVVLQVGLKLAKILKNQGYVVHLTRAKDQFVPLDERTEIANLYTQANLFVSLHANHAANVQTAGIETFYMHYDLLKNIDNKLHVDREFLNKYSKLLAQEVHASLISMLAGNKIVDRKVKQAVTQILLGVEMPAILIELGFISNKSEAGLLDCPKYQQRLALGIAQGINSYLHAV